MEDKYWVISVTTVCDNDFNIESTSRSVIQLNKERIHGTGKVHFYNSFRRLKPYWGHPEFNLDLVAPYSSLLTNKEVENHYIKVMQNCVAEIKRMVQVEYMSLKEAVDIINTQLNEGTGE